MTAWELGQLPANKPCAQPFPPPAPEAYENTFGQLFHQSM